MRERQAWSAVTVFVLICLASEPCVGLKTGADAVQSWVHTDAALAPVTDTQMLQTSNTSNTSNLTVGGGNSLLDPSAWCAPVVLLPSMGLTSGTTGTPCVNGTILTRPSSSNSSLPASCTIKCADGYYDPLYAYTNSTMSCNSSDVPAPNLICISNNVTMLELDENTIAAVFGAIAGVYLLYVFFSVTPVFLSSSSGGSTTSHLSKSHKKKAPPPPPDKPGTPPPASPAPAPVPAPVVVQAEPASPPPNGTRVTTDLSESKTERATRMVREMEESKAGKAKKAGAGKKEKKAHKKAASAKHASNNKHKPKNKRLGDSLVDSLASIYQFW